MPVLPAQGVPARGLLLLAVLLTGATSLAYEVAWTRGLVLVLGSTITSTSVALAVFVGALGIGARWGGPRADATRRPLALYGALEVGAAVWAVLALWLAEALLQPYASIAGSLPEFAGFLLRVLVAAIVVAPGAFLLGATLPALVSFWTGGGGEAGRGTAWVYGVNTVGAVLGALVTGFWGISALGVLSWLVVAATTAGVVGLLAMVVGGRAGHDGDSPATPGDRPISMPLPPALAAAAFCGALGLGLEVTGFRILVFFLEGFTATFAAMLGVFVLGLGLGSLVLGPWLGRSRRPDVALGGLLLLAAVAIYVESEWVIPQLEELVQGVRQAVYAGATDEAGVQSALRATALAGAAALLLVPAFLLGATFPLCVRWAELAGLAPGAAVGRVYIWNSLGTIVAPFLVGFWVVPVAGPLSAWWLLALAGALGALTVATSRVTWPRHRWVGQLMWVLIAAILILGPLDVQRDESNADLVGASHVLKDRPNRHLLEVRADVFTTASVIEENSGERFLYTDDFAAAATGRHYRYMRMLGHLPVLLAKDPQNAMVIAFGTGTTAGAVARHAAVARLEVVEVSEAVLHLAPYFEEANRNVLADRRTVVIEDDGRNALLLHEPDLDVITLEPLMPYSPAGLPFYTKEFYELARDRLRDGGVLCQWVPVHAMPAGLYAAFVRTFFEVFPEGQLWFFEQSSALIAVKGEGVSPEDFEARARAVADDLDDAGFTTPGLVLSGYVASGKHVLESPTPPSPFTGRTVTDLDPFPEFHPTPRASLNTTYLKDTLSYLTTLTLVRRGDAPPLTDPKARDLAERRQGTAEALGGRTAEALAEWSEIASRGQPRGSSARVALRTQAAEAWQAAARWYGQAAVHLPGESVITWRRARAQRRANELEIADLLARSVAARAAGKGAERDLLRAALELARSSVAEKDGFLHPGEWSRAQYQVALVLIHMGRCESAEQVLKEAEVGAPVHSAQGRDVFRLMRQLEWHRVRTPDGDVDPADLGPLAAAPLCRSEGLALVDVPLRRWRGVAGRGTPRAVGLAADNLVAAARVEGIAEELSDALREAGPPERHLAAAELAGMLARLDPDDPTLAILLREAPTELRAAAVTAAGRTHLLHLHPDAARALASAPAPSVRIALADAAAADGGTEMLLLAAGLLMDADRTVRTTAATALLRHVPTEIGQYDPDAPPAARSKVVEAIRTRLSDGVR